MNIKVHTKSQEYIWSVSELCSIVKQTLSAHLNPITVHGEISNLLIANSGHCYFQLKDAQSKLQCVMFRRAAQNLSFDIRNGDFIQAHGLINIYENRGELQLVIEHIKRNGQGILFEQFLLLKQRLQEQGLFDDKRKRQPPTMPRAIGVVTSSATAAWHDVITTICRRAPHVVVLLSPSSVQGKQASIQLINALQKLYKLSNSNKSNKKLSTPPIEAILLVRGGGSMEDLWAFNDESLAHTIACSPVPIISGIGHETDFTIADFVSDVRASTPTAAAELVTLPQEQHLQNLAQLQTRFNSAMRRTLDKYTQQIDYTRAKLSYPAWQISQQNQILKTKEQRLFSILQANFNKHYAYLQQLQQVFKLLDPNLPIQRGYAWLRDAKLCTISRVQQIKYNQIINAQLSNGELTLLIKNYVKKTNSN